MFNYPLAKYDWNRRDGPDFYIEMIGLRPLGGIRSMIRSCYGVRNMRKKFSYYFILVYPWSDIKSTTNYGPQSIICFIAHFKKSGFSIRER